MQQAFYIFAIAASLFSVVARASVPSKTTNVQTTPVMPKVVVGKNVDLKTVLVTNQHMTTTRAPYRLAPHHDYFISFKMTDGQLTVQKTAL